MGVKLFTNKATDKQTIRHTDRHNSHIERLKDKNREKNCYITHQQLFDIRKSIGKNCQIGNIYIKNAKLFN